MVSISCLILTLWSGSLKYGEMKGVPTQSEIDAVAYFVEAVHELKISPYFMEEYWSLNISWQENDSKDQIRGKFPDPNIVKAALVPFRRVWLQSEPCNHTRVTNLLRRYEPAYGDFLDPILFDEKNSIAKGFEWMKDCDLSPSGVVNLWLNTRYHHVGKGKSGRYTRADFERYQEELGPVFLEFYFLQTINEIGVSLFNIEKCASRFLEILGHNGHKPSFKIAAITDSSIERSTPGYTPEPDSPRQRVWKLRRRRHYEGVNRFFELTEFSDERLAVALMDCGTFAALVELFQLKFEHIDHFDERIQADKAVTAGAGCIDNHFAAVRNGRCRRGFIAKRTNRPFLIGEDYLAVVEDQYAEFRSAFLKEPFD